MRRGRPAKWVTPSPTSSTTPAASLPRTAGRSGTEYRPVRWYVSMKLRPIAVCRTRTSPRPGGGAAQSPPTEEPRDRPSRASGSHTAWADGIRQRMPRARLTGSSVEGQAQRGGTVGTPRARNRAHGLPRARRVRRQMARPGSVARERRSARPRTATRAPPRKHPVGERIERSVGRHHNRREERGAHALRSQSSVEPRREPDDEPAEESRDEGVRRTTMTERRTVGDAEGGADDIGIGQERDDRKHEELFREPAPSATLIHGPA